MDISRTTIARPDVAPPIARVIVPLDAHSSSERAVPVAGAVAGALGAGVELMTVCHDGRAPEPGPPRVEALAAGIRRGVEVTCSSPQTADSVMDALTRTDLGSGALVCVSSDGRGALRSVARGGVSAALVRRADVPVLIIGPECVHVDPPSADRPSVVAVDGGDRDDDALAMAARWARATGSDLIVVHVVTAPADPQAWARGQEIADDAQNGLRALGVEATTALRAAGDIGAGLLREVDESRAWGLVVGSHRRGSVGRAVLGSTVDRLVCEASVPVLVAARVDPSDDPAAAEEHEVVPHACVADDGVGRMDDAECFRLLATDDVGRLAIVQGHTPAVFPVNYVLDGRDIVFRTAPGTKLQHGPDSMAAFEIDGLDREWRTGWSVVVTGRLELVTRSDPERYGRLQGLPIGPWEPGPKDHIIRLVSGVVTGRTLAVRHPDHPEPAPVG